MYANIFRESKVNFHELKLPYIKSRITQPKRTLVLTLLFVHVLARTLVK